MNDMNDMLVVDDNPVLVSVLSEIFRELGYSVRAASDGFEALAANTEPRPRYSHLGLEHASYERGRTSFNRAEAISNDRSHRHERSIFRQ
jgi:DNA-binding NtrC family response regulator